MSTAMTAAQRMTCMSIIPPIIPPPIPGICASLVPARPKKKRDHAEEGNHRGIARVCQHYAFGSEPVELIGKYFGRERRRGIADARPVSINALPRGH